MSIELDYEFVFIIAGLDRVSERFVPLSKVRC